MLRAYPKETVIAEKLEAVTALGILNSRMKDFYDLALLSRCIPLMASVWQMRSSRPSGTEERQSKANPSGLRERIAMTPHGFSSGAPFYGGAGSKKSPVT